MLKEKLAGLYFGSDRNILKRCYFWNMTAGGLGAVFSTVILMVLTRTADLGAAGVFTIAYAASNLFYTVGLFGMRAYQVSDSNGMFSFFEYRRSRVYSCAAMLFVSLLYIGVNLACGNYDLQKSAVVLLMCVFKVIDAFEDVYMAFYQSRERLDVGAKMFTVRYVLVIIAFMISAVIDGGLLVPMLVAVAVSAGFSALSLALTVGRFVGDDDRAFSGSKVGRLLLECLPLCAIAFLSFYTANAPKYAIDLTLSDELQACYGFIAMPVFLVSVLNNFIFQPILPRLSGEWNSHDIPAFIRRIKRHAGILVLVLAAALLVAYFLGIPLLSLFYNTDLAAYKVEMMLMLLGGGVLAFDGFFLAVLTVMRRQKQLIFAYAGVAAAALLVSARVVGERGITGAAWLFLALTSALFAALFVLTAVNIAKAKKNVA